MDRQGCLFAWNRILVFKVCQSAQGHWIPNIRCGIKQAVRERENHNYWQAMYIHLTTSGSLTCPGHLGHTATREASVWVTEKKGVFRTRTILFANVEGDMEGWRIELWPKKFANEIVAWGRNKSTAYRTSRSRFLLVVAAGAQSCQCEGPVRGLWHRPWTLPPCFGHISCKSPSDTANSGGESTNKDRCQHECKFWNTTSIHQSIHLKEGSPSHLHLLQRFAHVGPHFPFHATWLQPFLHHFYQKWPKRDPLRVPGEHPSGPVPGMLLLQQKPHQSCPISYLV